jgi:hypothetical protein
MIFERDRLEAGRKRYSLQNATFFREEDHPRAEDGKFGKGGGGGESKEKTYSEHIDSNYKETLEKTSLETKKSLDTYCDTGYEKINNVLLGIEKTDSETNDHIKKISEYIQENRIKEDTVLYRGMTLENIDDIGTQGDSFSMKNFGSHSLSLKMAEEFTEDSLSIHKTRTPVILKVYAKKGAPVAPAIRRTGLRGQNKFDFNKAEQEFISDKGVSFYIKEKKRREDGVYLISLEVE